MLVEAFALLVVNLESATATVASGWLVDKWIQQRFVRGLARDVNKGYRGYKGKQPADCDRMLKQKVAHTRGLVGRIDSIIKDVRHSPRGKPWEARTGWRQRRKLRKLDRAVIDSLLAAIACSREGEAVSYEACSKHVSDAGEALRRRSLLVMNT